MRSSDQLAKHNKRGWEMAQSVTCMKAQIPSTHIKGSVMVLFKNHRSEAETKGGLRLAGQLV